MGLRRGIRSISVIPLDCVRSRHRTASMLEWQSSVSESSSLPLRLGLRSMRSLTSRVPFPGCRPLVSFEGLSGQLTVRTTLSVPVVRRVEPNAQRPVLAQLMLVALPGVNTAGQQPSVILGARPLSNWITFCPTHEAEQRSWTILRRHVGPAIEANRTRHPRRPGCRGREVPGEGKPWR